MNILTQKHYKFIKKNQYTILLCIIAILFFILLYNILKKNREPFISTVTKDCSDCKVQPSGSCIKLPTVIDNKIKEDSSFVFCKWQEQCSIQDELYFTKAEIDNENNQTVSGEITNYQCCRDSQFYSDYTTTINDMSRGFLESSYTRCNEIFSIIEDPDKEDKEIDRSEITACYKFKLDMSNNAYGLLFKRDEINRESIYKQDIIANSNVTRDYLLSYINRRYPLLEKWIKDTKGNNQVIEYRKIINSLQPSTLNKDLVYNGDINRIKSVLYTEYIKEYEENNQNHFEIGDTEKQFTNKIESIKYKWQLLDSSGEEVNSEYILNKNEFFKCNGSKESQDICDNLYNIDNKDDIFNEPSGNNDMGYFGVNDENIKTVADYKTTKDTIDRDMERLPTISNQSTMAPVSIINQYLSHITNFYNRQLNNMLGPQTHARQDKIRFNNNTLQNVASGYFTYSNNLTDASYETVPSITGDNSFNYTGPAPYFNTDFSYY